MSFLLLEDGSSKLLLEDGSSRLLLEDGATATTFLLLIRRKVDSMIIPPGATSQSITITIVDDSGLPVTGLVAATFPTTYYQRAGETLPSAITLSDLAAQNSSYSSGGVKE